ncbi:Xaa-Pro aminopeptidase [Alteromonas sp. ASW11-130]|uniref:Xaa-Pro aminopeptidase n=1 Tax=Alteromonas sp. ASW11-130 TaxID=3015775 RepID=UPI002241AAEF|nr:Xaa-Pro aminopeptidase [Alteromonas sp. ASW11-130]
MITQQEFTSRQDRLLAQCPPDSVCVIPSSTLVTRSRDTEYKFRQNSYFWYLTGFAEPDSVLLLSNHSRHPSAYRAMVCQAKDEHAEVWHGRRLGAQQALGQFDLDEAYENDQLDTILDEWLDGHSHVFFPLGEEAWAEKQVMESFQRLRNNPRKFLVPQHLSDPRPLLDEMRVFKSAAEIATMKAAAKMTSEAHCRAMQFARPGCYEYQLAAEIHHHIAMAGAHYPAYGTIVGSGENACILHYTENTDLIEDGNLVLIDAGAEYQGYAADITRTFPVSGKFTEAQAKVYQIVLKAQEAAIDLLKPGVTLTQANEASSKILIAGLIELGILNGTVEENLENQAYRAFYMHGLGHFLGLDVHDVGVYKIDGEDRPLKPGMVLTIEPGLYLPNHETVPEDYRGIGVRIEDNIVITAQGTEILTASVPKSIADIEALMSN